MRSRDLVFTGSERHLRILTWHIHGSYLYYLVQSPHEFYLPFKAGRPEGYAGRTESYPWPDNVHEVPAEEIRNLEIDCIVFQSRKNYLEDQYEILSEEQQQLPRIYLEHDPPREHPTDTRHPVDDPNVLLVHVTHFNDLMWDNGRTPVRVIERGTRVALDRWLVFCTSPVAEACVHGPHFPLACDAVPGILTRLAVPLRT